MSQTHLTGPEHPNESWIDLRDVRIHYVASGSGEPVILIHGLGNSIVSWRENIDALAERHTVYALDLPGHGLSTEYNGRYTLSYASQLMGQFIDSLGLGRVALVGNSLGGFVAMKTALAFPEKVSRLVLVGSAGLGKELAPFLRLLTVPGLGELMARPSRNKTKVTLQTLMHDKALVSDGLIDEVHRSRCRPGASRAMLRILRTGATFLGQKSRAILVDQLNTLNVPILLLWGAKDNVIPVQHAHRAHRRIKGSVLHIFEGCGHWPQMEKSDAFNSIVTNFLAGAQ